MRIRTYAAYLAYLASPEWEAKATEAKELADWSCALCSAHVDDLEVHHRTYARLGNERPEDLVVLCRRCHRRLHGTFDECVAQLALWFDRVA